MGSLRWFPRARNSCVGDRREQRAGERRAGLAGVGVQRATGQDTPLTASVQATDPAGTIARNQETKQTRRASGRAGCAHAQRERANARAGSAPESSCSADTDAGSKPCLLAFLPFRHSPIPESSSGARCGWVGEGARGRPKPSPAPPPAPPASGRGARACPRQSPPLRGARPPLCQEHRSAGAPPRAPACPA